MDFWPTLKNFNRWLLVVKIKTFVVNGTHIKKSDDIDLLGVNIDSKLTFDKHVSVVCSKVNKQLQVIMQAVQKASK